MLEQVDLEVESIVNQRMDGVSEAEVRSIRTEIEPILFLYQGVHDIERILRRWHFPPGCTREQMSLMLR